MKTILTSALIAMLSPASMPISSIASTGCGTNPVSASAMQDRTNQLKWVGDSGRIHKLSDGRLVQFFGDTQKPDGSMVHNSIKVYSVTKDEAWGPFFPDWPDGSRFWPGDYIGIGSRLYVLGTRQLVRGYFDWTPLGAYVASVVVPTCDTPTFESYHITPSSGLDDTVVQWSAAIAQDSLYVYLHGVLNRPDLFNIRNGGYTVRVPRTSLYFPTWQWQFWNGTSWTSELAQAVSTIPADEPVGGTESGYTLTRRVDGYWQVTTKRYGFIGDTLGKYTSSSPWGPWTSFVPLQVVNSSYLAGASNLVLSSGKQFVEWSVSNAGVVYAEVPQ